jgi:hypothetical protein
MRTLLFSILLGGVVVLWGGIFQSKAAESQRTIDVNPVDSTATLSDGCSRCLHSCIILCKKGEKCSSVCPQGEELVKKDVSRLNSVLKQLK